MRSNPPAVLLGGEAIAVSVARSLGRSGVEVYALGTASVDPVRFSRYCTQFVDLGSGEDVQDRWMDWLARTAGEPRVILPCNDDGLELVARRRSELGELGYRSIEADDSVLLTMLDKAQTYDLAARLGIASPKMYSVENPDALEPAVEELGFPLAVKPRHSYRFARQFGLRKKLFVVRDRAELEAVQAETTALGLEVIMTEIIPGGDDRLWTCTAYLDEQGSPLLHYTRRKVRQYPPGFGRGCYYVVEWDPEVAEVGLAFLRGAGIRGLASVEFKRDERDGYLKLIECNHRLDGATELARAGGVDLARFVYAQVLDPGGKTSRPREGVRLWNPIEDTRSAWELWRRGELSLGGWFRTLLYPLRFQVFDRHDIKPSLMGSARMTIHVLQRYI
jgi:predicted ATP-grasp superfamily ATP-dependent carboligase